MDKKIKVVFAGGGTGGHVFPALNLASAINEKWDASIKFFGTERGLEYTKVPSAGYELKIIPVVGFQRRLTLKNLMFPFKLWNSLRICKQQLKSLEPDIVIGTGGYVMGPVLKAAISLDIPTVIQEQNSYPGVTTRLLAPKADLVFLAYAEAKKFLKNAKNIHVTGNPINLKKPVSGRSEIAADYGLKPNLKTILVFGGSQGASSINNAVLQMIKNEKIPDGFQILWQTGKNEFDKYDLLLKKINSGKVVIKPFIDDMYNAYALADFAICRAGAMTLSELMAAGLPALLVPYPFAAADHQYKNAKMIEEKNAGMVVVDNKDMTEKICTMVNTIFVDQNRIKTFAMNMRSLHQPDTIDIILKRIELMLKQKNKWPFEN
ncbi:MAG: undecaprenyldiphospho-muramoylpentapeptide beta-N-acetylglucosaminyltransferase [Calditrichaceae bacterium]